MSLILVFFIHQLFTLHCIFLYALTLSLISCSLFLTNSQKGSYSKEKREKKVVDFQFHYYAGRNGNGAGPEKRVGGRYGEVRGCHLPSLPSSQRKEEGSRAVSNEMLIEGGLWGRDSESQPLATFKQSQIKTRVGVWLPAGGFEEQQGGQGPSAERWLCGVSGETGWVSFTKSGLPGGNMAGTVAGVVYNQGTFPVVLISLQTAWTSYQKSSDFQSLFREGP